MSETCPHCGLRGTMGHLHIWGIRFVALSCAGCDTTTPDFTGLKGWLLDKVFMNFWDGSTHLDAASQD